MRVFLPTSVNSTPGTPFQGFRSPSPARAEPTALAFLKSFKPALRCLSGLFKIFFPEHLSKPSLSTFMAGATTLMANSAHAQDSLEIKTDYSHEGFWIALTVGGFLAVTKPVYMIWSTRGEQGLLDKASLSCDQIENKNKIENEGSLYTIHPTNEPAEALKEALSQLCKKDAHGSLDQRSELQRVFSRMLDGIENNNNSLFAKIILQVFLKNPNSAIANAVLKDLLELPIEIQVQAFNGCASLLLSLAKKHPDYAPAVCRLGLQVFTCDDSQNTGQVFVGTGFNYAKDTYAHGVYSRDYIWDFLELAKTEPWALFVVAGMLIRIKSHESLVKAIEENSRWKTLMAVQPKWAEQALPVIQNGTIKNTLKDFLERAQAMTLNQLQKAPYCYWSEDSPPLHPKWDSAGLSLTPSTQAAPATNPETRPNASVIILSQYLNKYPR